MTDKEQMLQFKIFESVTLEELDEIVWVGPATAQKIIDARPFDSIGDLDKVSGIGEVKVSDIKAEGLACIYGEGEVDEVEEEPEEIVEVKDEEPEDIVLVSDSQKMISLNGNVDLELKYESEDSKIVSYLPLGFAVFLIALVGILIWEKF